MSKVAVITDSTAYLPDDLVKKLNITVAPQILIWGEQTFLDGVDIQPIEFYKRLTTAKVMPTTSQVTPVTMKAIYEKLLGEGCEIIGIYLSSKLSGTVQSALLAKDMIPEAKDKITVVDSCLTSMAMGFQVLRVAEAAQGGAKMAECQKIAEKAKAHTGVLFVVDTLEFLHRGGRIGGAKKFFGTALNIKPILELRDGRIEAVEQVRTKGKAYERMLELLEERIGGRTPLRLSSLHANAEADARSLFDKAVEKLHPIETVFASVSPVIGAQAGPGTVGLAYMAGM